MKLKWQEKGKHSIYQTEDSAFAEVPVLEHSVGPAGFEVYRYPSCDGSFSWVCMFWHGNQGHSIPGYKGARQMKNRREAQEAAQLHLDKLVNAWI